MPPFRSKKGIEFELLEKQLTVFLEKSTSDNGGQITKLRRQNTLTHAVDSISKARAAHDQKLSFEFVTVDLKAAIDSLDELIGTVYSEDLLDVIFAQFCIGK